MHLYKRFFCLLLSLAMVLSLLPATVLAAGDTYQLAQLLQDGQIKPLGRTAVNPDGTGIMCDWPGNGFQMNVTGSGGKMEITVATSYAANWAVQVDGEQVYWERLSATGGTICTTVPAGDHTVTVVKESDTTAKDTDFCDLTTMIYEGTLAAKPADKALTIEFIGDSYTCGHGTLGAYQPGRSWTGDEHSFTHGYAYYTAQNLNADYMIAARGGIGLFDGVSAEQPDDDPDATIADIYPYTAGFRKSAGLYDFARQADIVVIELGANDSIKESDANFTSAMWRAKLESLTDTVREKYPDAHIVFLSHRAQKFQIMKNICEDRAATDPKLYAFSYAHQGNGSGTATQYYGHPNAADSKNLADALSAFIVERGLAGKTVETEPTYTDYTYYASASGDDSSDGKSLATAKLTLTGALAQAKADRTYAAGERIVVNVEGQVNINPGNSQDLALVGDILLPDGSDVPILVQTNNFSGTKAVLDTNHKPSDSGSCMVWFSNSMTLKDITFQATTNEDKGTRDFQLYAGYNHIVFDNVTFATAGSKPTASNVKAAWYVSAAHAVASVAIPEDGESSITFKNGDYTDITAVAVYRGSLYSSSGSISNAPAIDAKVIIEDGAQMKNLYNRWGELGVGRSTVEIRGGTVTSYYGTVNSTSATYSNFIGDIDFVMHDGTVDKFYGTNPGSSSIHKTFDGDINFTMTGGKITGTGFAVLGSYADVTGNVTTNISGGDIHSDEFNVVNKNCTVSGAVTNNISGGIIEVRPTANYQAINFGARSSGTLGSVTNNISGGMFFIVFDTASINSGFYFGSESSTTITGKVTNNISGGSFIPMDGEAAAGHSAIYFATMSGALPGGLYNNITGGTFDVSAASGGGIYFGSYSKNIPIAKIVNVIGEKGTGKGPMLLGAEVYMAGSSAAVGVTAAPTAMPEVTECSDTVVLSNTFYGGYCDKAIYCGGKSADGTDAFRFIKGSIENNVYGGQWRGTFYGTGSADVYGKVTTNLYGGNIGNIYAGGNEATVYDGVELSIREGFREYHDVSKDNSWRFWGGTYAANIPAPQTAGRDAIKITVSAEDPANLVLKTPIAARCRSTYTVDGTVSVKIAGGTFPEGLTVSDLPVNSLLAEGYVITHTATGQLLSYTDTDTTTGLDSVTVMKAEDVKEPEIPEKYLATVKTGQIVAYPTTLAELLTAISSSGTSYVTLYDNISSDAEISIPFSCTLDLNGYTISTNPSSGNGIVIKSIGTQNAVTTVKNGTIRHYTIGIRVNAGAIIVDNMNVISNSGAPIGIYEPSAEYKDINKITGSFLSSKSYSCIAYNSTSDFTATGITVEDSTLVSHKAVGKTLITTKSSVGGGTTTFGKDVKLYTYASSVAGTGCPVDGEALTKTTDQSVTVDGTQYTGMNLWTTPETQYVALDPVTGSRYETVTEAVAALAATGGTVRLTKDINEQYISIWGGITLDLNGHVLETNYFTCYGQVVETGIGGEALLKVTESLHIPGEGSYLPIYDSAAGGYRFYTYTARHMGVQTGDNSVKFGIQIKFANKEAYRLMADTQNSGFDVFAYVNWTGLGNANRVLFTYRDETVSGYANALYENPEKNMVLTLTLTGVDVLGPEGEISLAPAFVSDTGVEVTCSAYTWKAVGQ